MLLSFSLFSSSPPRSVPSPFCPVVVPPLHRMQLAPNYTRPLAPSLSDRPTGSLSLCSASNCLTAGGHLVNSGPLRNPRGSQTVGWIFISPAYKSAHTHAEKTRREILPSRSAYYQASKPRQRGPNNVLRCKMNISKEHKQHISRGSLDLLSCRREETDSCQSMGALSVSFKCLHFFTELQLR